jgi:hypothetical protein
MALSEEGIMPEEVERYDWAVKIVQRRFTDDLLRFSSDEFVQERYSKFLHQHDPILYPLVMGMNDPPLQEAYVSFYSIFQTVATQTRFWLEAAISDILIHQVRTFGRSVTQVFTQNMLAEGKFDQRVTVADIGKAQLEHVSGKKQWLVNSKGASFDTAAELASDYDKKYDRGAVNLRKAELYQLEPELIELDHEQMRRMRHSVRGTRIVPHKLDCDLLVVGHDDRQNDISVRAFRFVNHKTFTKREKRKEERINQLRLMAYLVQEMVGTSPDAIEVQIAEIVPRQPRLNGPLGFPYFTKCSYWLGKRFWTEYIQVPFDVVEWAIQDVGQRILADRLRYLLPRR